MDQAGGTGRAAIALPVWAAAALSVVAVAHLAAVAVVGLGVPSGPWPGAEEPTYASAPAFTAELFGPCEQYLAALHLQEDAYLPANRHPEFLVYLEARLLDKDGNPIRDAKGELVPPLRFPDPAAPPSVQAWQRQLANHAAIDFPLSPGGNEPIAADRAKVEEATRWSMNEATRTMSLERVPKFRLRRPPEPRDFGPSDWSLAVVGGVRNYLLRKAESLGADGVEIVRFHQRAVAPDVLFERGAIDPEYFVPQGATFGARRR